MVDYELAEIVRLINRGFADYFVPVEFNRPLLLTMVQQDSIDVVCSRVVVHGKKPVGVALIARRGWTSRVAAMALVPEARGQGVGTWLMEQLMAEAKVRDEQTMVLEVIEQNTPAVRLYRRCGFQVQRRLVGLAPTQFEGATAADGLAAVDIREVARLVTMYGLPDLPWQIAGESLAQLAFPNRAYRLKDAYAVMSNPNKAQITLRTVLVRPAARHQGQATRLLQALSARYPGKQWRLPVLCPEELGGLFEQAGFERESLTQLQMKLDLLR
jgi:ribosomal protein S18 acetylase RimI-like enzyme